MGSSQSTSNSSNDCKHEGNGNMENFRSEKKQVKGNKYYILLPGNFKGPQNENQSRCKSRC